MQFPPGFYFVEVTMNYKFAFLATLAFLILTSTNGFAQDRVRPAEVRATAPPTTPPGAPDLARDAGSPPEILIGTGDLIEVSLYGVPDFKTDVRVSSAGEASVPMLGTVTVGGLSAEQAGRLIERQLKEKGFYNDPHVTVFEKEFATQGISVLGEVQKPGIYPLLGSRNLYDAISAAGGTTPKAGSYVMVTRRNDPQNPIRVPLSTGSPDSMKDNVSVEPGDTILVSKAGIVYVVGDVRQPGGFVMENGKGVTVLQAIALAQGIGPNASLGSARLVRKTPDGPKDVPLDLKKILSAKAADPHLQADDIVYVPDSAAKSGFKRGLEAALQTATGLAIWRVP
jgi:polysaccharide export outer membrane protein